MNLRESHDLHDKRKHNIEFGDKLAGLVLTAPTIIAIVIWCLFD